MSKIEKIERGYATIYIDREGETLEDEKLGFYPEHMVTDYYSDNRPHIQWNYYLIIPFTALRKAKWFFADPENPTDTELNSLRDKIIVNDTYARKYVLLPENVDKFVANFFPPIVPYTHGRVTIVKGIHREDLMFKIRKMKRSKEYKGYKFVDSFHRNFSSLKALYELDYLRKELIHYPDKKFVFYTHFRAEYNWACHKFFAFLPHEIDSL